MNRAQFMEQLKRLLSDISEAERNEALDYYESYFDDAGAENEASVIRELGSPGKVAAIIKADLQESNDRYAEYTENGYEDSRTKEPGQVPGMRKGSRAERGYHADRKKSMGMIILLLLAVAFMGLFAPVIIGAAAGGILGLAAAIVLLPFALTLAVGAGALGMMIGAIGCGAAGIILMFTHTAVGVFTVGIGCIMMAVGILLALLTAWIVGKALPRFMRWVTDSCYNLLHRERKAA